MDNLIITHKNEVYSQISCSNSIAQELRDYFTFEVPGARFTPQYKSRIWDGKIRLFSTSTHLIYRGLDKQIEKFCQERNYNFIYSKEIFDKSFSVQEAREFIEKLNLPFEVREYQIEAFIHGIRKYRSLLLSPTGSGKSLIIYLIIRYLLQTEKKGLIIVPTISLVEQMYTDFISYGYDSESMHKIYQGQEKKSDKQIVIGTWQSLYKLSPEYFSDYDFVIGDESHLYKAKSLIAIMTKLINTKYRIGTTGTLDGTHTNKLVLEGLFGPVKKITTTKELMDEQYLSNFEIKCLILKHPEDVCQKLRKSSYLEEVEYIVENKKRNEFIANLTLSLEGNTLLLFQYVEKHGKILYDIISKNTDKNRKCFFIYGKTAVEIREETRAIMETEKNAIIIASYGVYSTGVNIKNLHNIIFAFPSKSRIRNLQSIGRGLRISETKTHATLYDIADDLRWKRHENYTLKHFLERIKLYSEEKFKFKVYKIDLK